MSKKLVTQTGFKIEDVLWYTPMGGPLIGIVKGQSQHGEKKYYIGVAIGNDEDADAISIAERGAKFYPQVFMENYE